MYGSSIRSDAASYLSSGTCIENFLAMSNGGDEIWVICLVLLQDKSELNTIVNVNYCKLLAHIFS